MKLMFVDESKKQGQGYTKEAFVMAGLVVDAENLIKIENLLEDLKKRYGIEKIEHIKKIPVQEARLAFTIELREILFDNNCYVLSAIYGEIALDNFKKIEEVYPSCFQFLLERFFMNLNMKNEQGIIFHDEFGKPYGQKFIKSSYEEIKDGVFSCSWNKTKTPFRERIHSQIFFGKDDFSNVLQAADVIASTLNYSYIKLKPKLEKLHMIKDNIPMLKEENDYLKIYWDLFVKKPRTEDPSGYGIKIWI